MSFTLPDLYISCERIQPRSRGGGVRGVMHPSKSAKGLLLVTKCAKNGVFVKRVKGYEVQKVHFLGSKGPHFGGSALPKSIQATGLVLYNENSLTLTPKSRRACLAQFIFYPARSAGQGIILLQFLLLSSSSICQHVNISETLCPIMLILGHNRQVEQKPGGRGRGRE